MNYDTKMKTKTCLHDPHGGSAKYTPPVIVTSFLSVEKKTGPVETMRATAVVNLFLRRPPLFCKADQSPPASRLSRCSRVSSSLPPPSHASAGAGGPGRPGRRPGRRRAERRRLERRQHASDVDHTAEHVAGAVGGLPVRGGPEAGLAETGRLAARGVLDVHVAGRLVCRAVGRVRVAGLAVDGGPCATEEAEGGGGG